jgi:predicted TIM-barrel fold metal-dependent hydrolase
MTEESADRQAGGGQREERRNKERMPAMATMTQQRYETADEIAADLDAGPEVPRALDIDSHEMVPLHLRNEIFGPTELQRVIATKVNMPANHPNAAQRHVTEDDTPINYENVWTIKGGSAPSAIDLGRRPEVLDVMGIQRQLCYPTFGLAALIMAQDHNANGFFNFEPGTVENPTKIGLEAIDAHNRWAARMTKQTDQRVRPVGIIMTHSVEFMVEQARTMIAQGIRAVMIPANEPPAGTSPGDPALDPFWALCAEANVPVTLHLGTERGFVADGKWSNGVDVFKPSFNSTIEFVIEPLSCVTLHYAPENFLAAMVLGGVFERHPTLRFGIIELSASWVGPLADRMDMWALEMFKPRFSATLSLRPSEYLARNVRVTPFFFEPTATYFERYPHLSDVFCYSSDYPHFEGGKDSKRFFARVLRDRSADERDKFFYRNAELLLPE